MFKIVVCMENEKKRQELAEELVKWKGRSGIQVVLRVYPNGEIFKFCMMDEDTPDVLFMDVCHDSKQTQKILLEYRMDSAVTRFVNVGMFQRNDMNKMYEMNATFIMEPLDKEQINELLKREYKRYYSDDESYVFMKRPQFIKLALKRVMYFSSQQRKIKAVCYDGTIYEFYKQLDHVEEELRGKRIKFIRTHQSHLVNPEFIKGYCGNEILLKNGDKLTIAATRRRRVRLQFQMLDILR